MLRQRLFLPKLIVSLCMLVIVISFGMTFVGNATALGVKDQADSPNSVHALLSGLSDEQIRQLLIDELQKDTSAESQSFSLEPELKGPGAPLARILKALNRGSVQSEHQLHKLWIEIPNLLPELYKVFISL